MLRRLAWRSFLLVVLFAGFPSAPPALADAGGYPHRPGEVLIQFKDSATQRQRNDILADLGAKKVHKLGHLEIQHAQISKLTVEQAVARYKNNPLVEFIEPNFIYKAEKTPNDPRFNQLWGLANAGQTGGTPGADIHATNAWDILTGGQDVLVAIIDTGMDYGHPDLAGNVYTNPNEIPGNGLDDDHNGFIDDVHGWDFVNGDSDPMDDNGHGTHTSGTIGAMGNNAVGVVGVNWRIKLMPVKFLNSYGSGTTADAISSVDYATSMGVRIMSNSWGSRSYSEGLKQAIQRADAAGILFVAAAGNDGVNNDIDPHYPSSYDVPNIISVAATDHNDRLADFSNYGPASVDLGAPGVDILSTFPGGAYGYASGTSMATPHVSGVLGLILGRFPSIGAPEAKALLLDNVDALASLQGRLLTGGRLNAFGPIATPDSIPPAAITDLWTSDPNGQRITLHWTATGDDGSTGTASRYDVRYSTSPIDAANFGATTQALGEPDPQPAGSPEQMQVTGLGFSTTYYFAIKAVDEYGNASPISNVPTRSTLGPPDIAVAPESLRADLLTGQTSAQILTLQNTGPSELNFDISIEGGTARLSAARPQVLRTFTGRRPEPGAGLETHLAVSAPKSSAPYALGHSPARAPLLPGQIRIGNLLSAGGMRILLLNSGGDVSEIQSLLASFPDVSTVDVFDANSSTPTLDDLITYHAVIVVASLAFLDPVTTGNVLADYADTGGGVVLTLASFIQGWNLAGRFIDQGYSPFTLGSGPAGSSSLGNFNAAHPIMSGVRTAWGDILGIVGLAPGAEWVADWQFGQPCIATKGYNVAAVNVFVGASGYWTGDIPLILHNAAAWSGNAATWLSAAPTSGVVAANQSLGVVVTFDAASLNGGDYSGRILVHSNDPDETDVPVPAHLHVTGAPDIALSASTLDYGSLFIGATRIDTLVVSNAGTDLLVVGGVGVAGAGFSAPAAGFALAPRERHDLLVTFAPSVAGPIQGTLTIQSNDPDESVVHVQLQGVGLVPPVLSVAPTSFADSLFTGSSSTHTLTLDNRGGSDLTFEIALEGVAGATSSATMARTGAPGEILAAGRPVPAAELRGAKLPFPIRMQMGSTDRSQAPGAALARSSGTGRQMIASGEEMFGDRSNAYFGGLRSRGNIFHCTTTTNLIEHRFWLGPTTSGEMWFLIYEGIAQAGVYNLISASNVSPAAPGEGWYSSGIINVSMVAGRFYLIVASWQAESTYYNQQWISPYPIPASFGELIAGAGWDWGPDTSFPPLPSQSVPDWAFGSPTAYYQTLVTGVGTRWLTVAPNSGRIPTSSTLDLAVRFDAAGLIGGDYRANIIVNNNDPLRNRVVVPASLHVTGAPDIALSASAFDYGPLFIGATRTDTLVVSNVGTDVLVVNSIVSNLADFTPSPVNFALAVGEHRDVLVTFRPSAAGAIQGALTIRSNDPDESLLTVTLRGEGLIAPDIAVSPDSLSADLLTGARSIQPLTIANQGGSDLHWSVAANFASSSSVLASSPIFRPSDLVRPVKTLSTRPPAKPRPEDIYVFGGDSGPSGDADKDRKREAVAGQALSGGAGLEAVLQNLNAGYAAVTGAIPNRFDFSEGETGQYISDGGNDMYDGGNFLGTNLGGPLEYSNNAIVSSPAFGPGGRYFTRKYPGMFVLVADMQGVDAFTISGNLGADGGGNADGATLQTVLHGIRYYGFVKRVFNAYDPSVNHLIIVADNATANHEFSTNTDDDYHRVFNLSASTRIYYVLYAGADGSYIGNAAALNIMNIFLETLGLAPGWLSFDPPSGTVPQHDSRPVNVTFDATGLDGGNYPANIVVTSNDPDEREVIVRSHLHVTGAPDIAVSDSTFDFGSMFLGTSKSDTLVVSNPGTDVLVVSGVGVSNSNFSVPGGGFTLAPRQSRTLVVTFTPSTPGLIQGLLTLASNDPDEGVVSVSLHGQGLLPPVCRVRPPLLTANLFAGQTSAQTLWIRNSGGSDLRFDLEMQRGTQVEDPGVARKYAASPSAGASAARVDGAGTDRPDRPGTPPIFGDRRAPSRLGTSFTFQDNFEDGNFDGWTNAGGSGVKEVTRATAANGTVYSYHEYNSSGSHFSGIYQTFGATQPKYASFWIRSGSTATDDSYFVLTTSGGMDAIFFFAQSNGTFYINGDVGGHATYPYTANAWYHIEFRNIDFAAQRFDYWVNGVSIQEHIPFRYAGTIGEFYRLDLYSWTPGAQAWWDEIYVSTAESVDWLTLAPLSGVVLAGESLGVAATFSAANRTPGNYDATVFVNSNDPDPLRHQIAVPAHLHVVGAPDIKVSARTVDFGPLFVGATKRDSLVVSNVGTEVLTVSGIGSNNPAFTAAPASFEVAVGGKRTVVLTFGPGAIGPIYGILTIQSNDPDEGALAVGMLGVGVSPPVIGWSPTSLSDSLFTGSCSDHTLTLENKGESAVVFSVSTQIRTAQLAPAASSGVVAVQAGAAAGTLGARIVSAAGAPPAARAAGAAGTVAEAVPGDIVAAGRPVPLAELRGARLPFPTRMQVGSPDRNQTPDTALARPSGTGGQRIASGEEVFGDPSNPYLGGLRSRGNIFHCTTTTDLIEHRFWLGPTTSGEMWFLVYEGSAQAGVYDLISASNVSPAAPGQGWYSSGTVDVSMVAGRFYLILAAWQANSRYYNQLGISPYPIPASFGELVASAGWNWTPDTSFPPLPAQSVPAWAFGEPVAYYQTLITGASWITVSPTSGTIPPHSRLDLGVTLCATDLIVGDYLANIIVSNNDPLRNRVVVPVSLHVQDFTVTFALDPNTLNLKSRGQWVTGFVELPAGHDAAEVLLPSVRLNGSVPADESHELGDHNGNGRADILLKFDRAAVEQTLQEGDDVEVVVSGDLESGARFTGTDVLHVIKHHVLAPNGGESLTTGRTFQVVWSTPTNWNPSHAALYYSRDGGRSWSLVAADLPGESFLWRVPAASGAQKARVRIYLYDSDGLIGYDSSDGDFTIREGATSADTYAPVVHALLQNTPNPFNPSTRIAFDLPVASSVRLGIYDPTGQLVRVLAAAWMPAGRHEATWDGLDARGEPMPSGLYFYRLQAGDFTATRRMVLLK